MKTTPKENEPARKQRRIAKFILAVVLGLVVLEVALQVASYVVYRRHSRTEVSASAEGGSTILCIGDSYTYGVGASSGEHTYPSLMAASISERSGIPPTVINAGWPGLNSRDLLSRIDGQLERFSPDVVVILIGLNDTWSRPAHLVLGEGSHGAAGSSASQWRWRWRTRRLVLWALAGGNPSFSPASPSQSSPRQADRQGPGAESGDDFLRAVSLLSSGEHEAAAAALERALLSQPERAAEIHQGLVQTYTILGLSEKASESLAWLEGEYARDASLESTSALVGALAAARENVRSFEVASAGLEAYPESSQLWWFQGQEFYRRGELGSAENAFDRALEHADHSDRVWHAVLMRDCAQVCAARDPKKALKLAISSFILDQNMGKTLIALESGRDAFTPELGTQSLAELDLAPDAQRAGQVLLNALFTTAAAQSASAAVGRNLSSHLRQMIARCEASGARLVLLTYPMPAPRVEAAVRTVARETGVKRVEMRPHFEAAARANPTGVLFVPDGHCADAGYGLMGRAAAQAVLDAVEPLGG